MKNFIHIISVWSFLALAFASTAFAQGTTPQTSGEHFAEGNKFYRVKNWAKAIEHYTESIKMREENAPAFLMRGTALTNRKEFDKAIADYTQAIALDPWEYLAYFRRSETYKLQGKKELADADVNAFKTKFAEKAKPRTAMEFYERGDYFAERGFWGDATVDYGDAIKLDARVKNGFPPVTAYEKRGDLYARADKIEDALKDYASALAQTQTPRPQIHFKRAEIYYTEFTLEGDQKMLDSALADYSELIASQRKNFVSDDDVVYALGKRASIYDSRKDWDKAIADYTAALQLNPNDAKLFTRRANAQSDKGDTEKAVRDYDQSIALDPKTAWSFNGRGSAYRKLNLTDKAIADYSKAIELSPKYFYPHFNLGLLYADKSDWDKAESYYTQALAIDPKFADALNNRGVIYIKQKAWGKALADLDQAIALDAKFAHAHNNRSLAYRGQLKWDKAIADCTQAIALDPNFATAYTNRAWVYRKIGKTAEAQADEKKVGELKAAG